MAPWTPSEKWSQAKKDAHDRNADRTNKVWGNENETERKEGVVKEFELSKEVKSKINSTVSTNEGQSSTSKDNNKSQKM